MIAKYENEVAGSSCVEDKKHERVVYLEFVIYDCHLKKLIPIELFHYLIITVQIEISRLMPRNIYKEVNKLE